MSEASPTPTVQTAPLSKLAVASLITGIVSLPVCGGAVIGIAACWMGWVALRHIERSGGTIRGKATARAGVITGAIGTALSISLAALLIYQNTAEIKESKLDAAEKDLFTQAGGQVAFGNTPEARELAAKLIAAIESHTATLSEKPSGLSILGDDFLGFAWSSKQGTAFIVSIPNLSKYSDASQQAIFAASWSEARRLLQEAGHKEGSGLALAPRGTLAYEQILIGKLSAEPASAANPLPGVTKLQAREKDLERFFR